MDRITSESFLNILEHLSERDRIRVLCTCKNMRVWLQKRESIAKAAFDEFKAWAVEEEEGWYYDSLPLTVRTSEDFFYPRGRSRWSLTVSLLKENSLIKIVETNEFKMNGGMNLNPMTDYRYFTPWFRAMTSSRGGGNKKKGTSSKIPDDDIILQRLLSVSPRLPLP